MTKNNDNNLYITKFININLFSNKEYDHTNTQVYIIKDTVKSLYNRFYQELESTILYKFYQPNINKKLYLITSTRNLHAHHTYNLIQQMQIINANVSPIDTVIKDINMMILNSKSFDDITNNFLKQFLLNFHNYNSTIFNKKHIFLKSNNHIVNLIKLAMKEKKLLI
jgi:hypothetical protein